MKTRNQAKRPRQSSGEEYNGELLHAPESCKSGSHSSISQKSDGKLLKRGRLHGSPRLTKQDGSLGHCDSIDKFDNGSKEKDEQVRYTRNASKISEAETSARDEKLSTTPELKVEGASIQHLNPGLENVLDELEWEDGSATVSNSRNYCREDQNKGITIEFDATPDTAKRKPVRRASAEEKEVAELVHCVHLLCLLGRGRIIDSACTNPLIQASLLSIIPTHLLKISEVPELTAKALVPLVNWFHSNFRIRSPSSTGRAFHSALEHALETREGTPEEVTALSVALFRALNISTRFVAILDVTSLKPDASKSNSISQVASAPGRGIFNSSTVMVDRSNQVSKSPIKHSAFDDKKTACVTSAKGSCESKINESSRSISRHIKSSVDNQLNDKRSASVASEAHSDTSDITEKSEGSKRKGDIEFEMQLQMALSATKVGTSESNASSDVKDSPSSLSNLSPFKKFKRIRGEESSSEGVSTAVGSRKMGPPLYWAEVYCSGETATGKWVHVDVVTADVGGADKVESAAAACKTSLRYAVAFAGQGAKDVTRRYCAKWYKVASQRVSPTWWDAVLAPLREFESGSTGGVVHLKKKALNKLENEEARISMECSPSECLQDHKLTEGNSETKNVVFSVGSSFVATRTSLEDMELETKALTEPLPTNQLAYKNHHLYALERWLTKYQILHPKGPVLGLCSGHPVYPRTCVQELHTRERWLREGLQIKVNELPVKELKRSQKLSRTAVSEPDDCDDRDCKGPGGTITLYGKWQTEPLILPRAVNGIVPKNERGQVDVWSEKCLPPGTVHLGYQRIHAIAKRLEIDYAPAMVGFEFRNGHSYPVYNGIVVCAEFKDAILAAYGEEEERRLAEDKRKKEAQAISRWYQLLSSIVTRQRLENRYGNGASADTSHGSQKTEDRTCEQIDGNREQVQKPECQDTNMHDSILNDMLQGYTEEHEHVFLKDDQSFDEKTSIRTKRCRCGFSIEVEDM